MICPVCTIECWISISTLDVCVRVAPGPPGTPAEEPLPEVVTIPAAAEDDDDEEGPGPLDDDAAEDEAAEGPAVAVDAEEAIALLSISVS